MTFELYCLLFGINHVLFFFLFIIFFSTLQNYSKIQYWLYSKIGEIRRDEACVDYAGRDVILYPCHGSKGNQYWSYNHEVSSSFFLVILHSVNFFYLFLRIFQNSTKKNFRFINKISVAF